jgi:hypothetical protein
MRGAILLLLAILVGLLAASWAISVSSENCPLILNRADKEHSEITNSASGGGSQRYYAANNSVPHAKQLQSQTKQKNGKDANNYGGSWGAEFWCKAHVTDYAIAFFTYCLAIVGIFAMWSAEQVARNSERGHLFPMVTINWVGGPPPVAQVQVAPKNSGRGGAIQRGIYGAFSHRRPITLLWKDGQLATSDEVVEGGDFSNARAGFSSRLTGDQYFCGYIAYFDLFHKRHKTFFCMKINPNSTHPMWASDFWGRWLNRFY